MKENGTAPPSWEGKRSAAAPPDAEVVDKPSRRRFSPSYTLRIVAAADRCPEPGAVGRLLRREGLYSSHLTTWRKAARSLLRLRAPLGRCRTGRSGGVGSPGTRHPSGTRTNPLAGRPTTGAGRLDLGADLVWQRCLRHLREDLNR